MQRLLPAAIVLGLALVPASAGVPGKYAAALAYSRCMRSHGVPGFLDPKQLAGGGIQIAGSQVGMSPESPVFHSAQGSCRHMLPNGGVPTRKGQQQELARMLHISQCMRAHRVPGFPDPTLVPPSNRAAYGDLMSNDGVWLAIPGSIDVGSSLFKQAAVVCDLGLS